MRLCCRARPPPRPQDGALPGWLPSLRMPTAPFDLTSFALALLLVFRTNTSYDRWDKACSLWGTVATCSRNTLRQVGLFLPSGDCSFLSLLQRRRKGCSGRGPLG